VKKNPTIFFTCTNCGAQFTKWTGRCLECGKWGTIEKEQRSGSSGQKNDEQIYSSIKTVALNEISGKNVARMTTNISELDRVLGGGIVPGSLILLGGSPGIGKSTLSLQIAASIPNTLYVSAEESVEQVKLRADRLKITSTTLKLANESVIEHIIATIKETKPALAILDSIQTLYSNEVEGEAGNLNQVRASTVKLLEAAKSLTIPLILIGHVTKEGVVAGPKTLEHLVDTVLYLEGDQHHFFRILRTVKNRFGATDEIGVFQMVESGLEEVKNPSAAFLADRAEATPGNVLTCLMEGTRPIMVEVQALVSKTAFGYPTRKASGFDVNRLHVLIAVLQKRAGLHLEQYDIHLNIVGGLEADEPAADLAVALAIASAFKDKALGQDLAVFGEVGLGGEIRSVAQIEKRIKECEQLGLKRIITTVNSKTKLPSTKLKIITIKNIQELITHT
jgi:DNA repair protein RadA/Sms